MNVQEFLAVHPVLAKAKMKQRQERQEKADEEVEVGDINRSCDVM